MIVIAEKAGAQDLLAKLKDIRFMGEVNDQYTHLLASASRQPSTNGSHTSAHPGSSEVEAAIEDDGSAEFGEVGLHVSLVERAADSDDETPDDGIYHLIPDPVPQNAASQCGA